MAKKNMKMTVIAIVAGLGVLLGSGALIRQASSEKTKELPTYSYSIGAIDDAGEFDKKDKSSITSEEIKVKDLVSIEIEEDADVIVYVHYYNEDDEYIRSVEVVGEELEEVEGAETCRVEIVPTDDDDDEVSAFEKGTYAKLVTVTLKK